MKNVKNVPTIKVFWTQLKIGSKDFDYILSESSASVVVSVTLRKSFVQKKICFLDFCDEPTSLNEPKYVLNLADMSRYEIET